MRRRRNVNRNERKKEELARMERDGEVLDAGGETETFTDPTA